ncbi:PAS domain S-box protein [Granulicella mallensis]|uniref:histidine kinase n=1 Tax=Granulicella mallensis TaxID=940614 RepID=A0A7W7ZRN6_9BACT|nr:PAS domain S-box protein [Granulicella mallensis]MBB5064528.1 PAS domain S-box-containing protein [Granulicella mallensis]
MNKASLTSRANELITGLSEMAALIRVHNWSKTPLGPIEGWSETLLATVNLMLHSPFPTILSWGPEMVFLYNDAAISTLTTKHPNALGGLYRDVFHEAWELVSADLEDCFYRGKTAVRDNMFIPILFNGVIEDHFWSYSLIPVYENGRIGGVYDAFRNMTEVVVGARRLRESEARLKLATEVAELGVFVWDTVEDLGSWENDRMYEIFGRTREDGPVSGDTFMNEIVHPDYRSAFRQAMDATLQEGEPFHFKGPMYLADKSLRWIEVNGNLQPSTDGAIGKILGTMRDITEMQKVEEEVLAGAARLGELAAIVASSDDVILSKNLNGIITSWNDAAVRVFGYSADEIVGTSILKLIPEELYSDEKTIIEHIRAGRRVEHFETVRVTKDGRTIEVSLTVSPIKDKTGRVIGASKILRDISSRKRIEQSLLQAEKIAATGRMAATIAHEINNPLEAVMNLLYLLRPKITDDDGRGYLATAEDELGRVSHIAKQTLGYYREHAAASLASLSVITEHALTIYEPRCVIAGIGIKKFLDSKTKVVFRRGEMMQVISNLIANSIYAMPTGGTLSVSVHDVTSPNEGIVLAIEDTGVGITPDVLPRVFEAFFTTRTTVGTGIGLFVAKQFVEGHGGRISIESRSEPEDHGTTVRIFLPLQTAYA